MGIFSSNKRAAVEWTEIEFVEQLEDIIYSSEQKVLLFFKHSTRCPISSFALRRFEEEWNDATNASTYFIDLLAHRDVSDALSRLSGISHQSPQVLVIKGEKTLHHASHEQIDANEIMNLINKPS